MPTTKNAFAFSVSTLASCVESCCDADFRLSMRMDSPSIVAVWRWIVVFRSAIIAESLASCARSATFDLFDFASCDAVACARATSASTRAITSLRFSICRASGSSVLLDFFPFGSPFTRDMLASTFMMKSSAWSTMRVNESFCAESCVASCVCSTTAMAAVLSARLCSGVGPQATTASADNVANVRRGVFMVGRR